MKLVRANKMHLAHQAGLISQPSEVMRKSGDASDHFCGVVVGTHARGELAGHCGKTGWGANGIAAVGVLEGRTSREQLVEVWRDAELVSVCRKSCGEHLINLQEENVGL